MKKIVLIAVGALLIGFAGCKPEDDPPVIIPEPEVSEMSVVINHMFGSQDFKLSTNYTLPSDEDVQFTRFAYLLSNFYLVKTNNSKVVLNDQYAYISIKEGKTLFTLKNVPMGEYKSIGLSVGLDSSINHGNTNAYAAEHPLAPINNSLYWGWTGGYIFTAIEGKTLGNNESFIFHLAGTENKVDFVLPLSFTKKESELKATLSYNVAEIFQNPSLYKISVDGSSTHSTSDPITKKLFSNMVDVFTLKSVTE